jgi:hypothetical protein
VGALLVAALALLATGPSATTTLHRVANSHYCDGCTPPLLYDGGPVVDTAGKAGFTVTPVFWLPAGHRYLPTSQKYAVTIAGYVANLQEASGTDGNVTSIATEYYGPGKSHINDRITLGTPIVDSQPFPASGCKVADGYSTCVTDGQLEAELARLLHARGLPAGLARFYPVFFPLGVETQDSDGTNSVDSYCGYHSSFGKGAGVVLYGNEPLEQSGCDAGQAPNGALVVDAAIDTLSHELMETMTDPLGTAWGDSSGAEIGDVCASFYGVPLGSTDPNDPAHTLYNQAIGSGHYYTQTEFSNEAYAKFGVGNGCQPSEAAVGAGAPKATQSGITLQSQLLPDISLPANGTAKTHDNVYVTDRQGNAISGDPFSFSTYLIAGSGTCGTLSKSHAVTGSDGSVDLVYTASTANAECGIITTEGKGGKTVTAPVYQGTYRAFAPTADDTIPETLHAGRTATFTVTYGNRTSDPIPYGTVDMAIFPDSSSSPSISAAHVSLSASVGGRAFTPLAVKSFDDGHIEVRYVSPTHVGVTIPAHKKVTFTFKLTLGTNAPSRGKTPVMDIEAYLDQLNPATGTFTTLADTGYTAAAVTH